MNQYQTRARGLLFLLMFGALLSATPEAGAQPFRLQCDGVSAIGGVSSAAIGNLLAVGGQAHPLGSASNSNHIVNPGFIYCLFGGTGCSGAAVAKVECPAAPATGRQFQARLMIDVSRLVAPDSLLGSFTGSLNWNPALLSYVSHSGLTSGFTGAINTTNASAGLLEFNSANAGGAGGNVNLLSVTFNVIGMAGAAGALDLSYSDMLSAGTFRNLLPCLTVTDCPFTIVSPSACRVCGDVNDDGVAGSSDALIILSYNVGLPIPALFLDKINAGCGDVDVNTSTSSSDALIILTYDAGLPTPFRVGQPGGCSSGNQPEPPPKPEVRKIEMSENRD